MMVPVLPTDDEFIDHLYSQFWDADWAETFASAARSLPGDPADPGGEVTLAELGDPKRLYRGAIINTISQYALLALGDRANLVKNIPVCMLPTSEFNACAIRSPRGGRIIVLNSSVLAILMLLVRSYTSLETWDSDRPFCRDHPQEDFAKTIVHLALFCTTGNFDYIKRAPAVDCPSLSMFDQHSTHYSMIIEIFLLLHEYGHVLLGHLDENNTVPLELSAGDCSVYFKNRDQEFAADKFALEILLNNWAPLREFVLAGCGVLLGFCGLADAFLSLHKRSSDIIMTHPPARERWEQIAKLGGLSDMPHTAAASCNYWFDRLHAFANLS